MTSPAHPIRIASRDRDLRAGVRVEVLTLIWMVAEAALAIGAGALARSALLTAFGIDSVIELVAAAVLLWRLLVEARGAPIDRVARAERRAATATGWALVMLCAYILITAAVSLVARAHPESSVVGLAVTGAALLVMPLLTARKRQLAGRLDSAALRGDAACSVTCAYLAATAVIGLALNAALGWWWADAVAALALLYWLVREAREALTGGCTSSCGCS